MEDTEAEVIYAMQLSGLHIGKRVTWLKPYTQKGVKKEKVVTVPNVIAIDHKPKNIGVSFKTRKTYTSWTGTKTYYYVNERLVVKPDMLVAVYDK